MRAHSSGRFHVGEGVWVFWWMVGCWWVNGRKLSGGMDLFLVLMIFFGVWFGNWSEIIRFFS